MNHRCSAVTLTQALALVGVLELGGCYARPRAERQGPFLSIFGPERARAGSRAAENRRQNMTAWVPLALGGLPAEELARLREHLEESAEAIARRAEPMLFDLMGSDQEDAALASDPLRQVLPDLPALTAAANVAGSPWNAPGLYVELGPACNASALRCVPVFMPATDRGDALLRHGRALAWTLANASLLRVPARSRAALLRSLREAQTRPSGTIALVYSAPRGALDETELQQLREQASQAVTHLPQDAPQRAWLDALGAAQGEWELPVAFRADEVLVIPRLSALARLQDFRAEVDAALARL
jgi:hypothetical protein